MRLIRLRKSNWPRSPRLWSDGSLELTLEQLQAALPGLVLPGTSWEQLLQLFEWQEEWFGSASRNRSSWLPSRWLLLAKEQSGGEVAGCFWVVLPRLLYFSPQWNCSFVVCLTLAPVCFHRQNWDVSLTEVSAVGRIINTERVYNLNEV